MDLLLLVILAVASNNPGLQAQSPETTPLLPETESLPTTPGCVHGDLRLEGGRTSSEGRVEICLNGEWGTVCDDSWDDDDSSVVCRQLGFSGDGAIALCEAEFGEGTGAIWLDEVECSGTESRLTDCRAQPVGGHDCNHTEDAGVQCELSSGFLLFGEDAGDSIGPRADNNVTSSIRLSEPIVYFREEYDTVFVSTNGLLSFNGVFSAVIPCDLPCTPVPVIAPAWADWTFQDSGTIYYRVAQDQVTLDQVVEMITDVNPELSDYMPTLAVIVTWFEARLVIDQSIENIFQAVISTDGEHSFAALLYEDPMLTSAFVYVDSLLVIGFSAAGDSADIGDTLLRSSLESTNIYRIDGPCITTVFPGDVCPLDALVGECDEDLSAINCTCEPGFTGDGVTCDEIDECLLGFCGDNSECLNTLGSFRCICNTGYVMDGPNNCVATDFILFGVEAGDSIGPRADDRVSSIRLREPILYLEGVYSTFDVSTNGLLLFDDAVIAPAWTNWTFEDSGTIYYRVAQDQVTLDQVVGMITEVNPELSDYLPTLAVIVTWFEARLSTNQSVVNTFQAVISTDGERSFAALLYADPIVDFIFIGFTSAQGGRADIGNTLLQRGSFWESTNVYRIDGPCITTAFPGDVCPLEAVVAVCNHENLAAIDCTCDEGFEYQRTRCLDINECDEDPSPCHPNSICSNSVGSFECTCEPGFTGDGITCDEMDECILGVCGDNSQCFNTLGSFRCICNTGYMMDRPNNCVTATSTSSSVVAAAVSVVIIVVVAIVVTVTVVIVVCLIRRKKHKQRHDLSARNEGFDPGENEYFQRLRQMSVQSSFTLNVSKSLLVNSCNLQLGKSIGQGEFGIVYKGLLKKGFTESFTETVAVKTLKGFLEKELVKDLLKECAKMKEFDHPNVLTLRGVCLDGGPAPYIIMPFMTNGSLHGYLRENREKLVIDQSSTKDLDDMAEVQKKLLDMCIQVAKGMEYLASKRLVHRDLAARNCMIDSGFVIKVADFGLSESMDITKEYFRQNKDEAIKLPIKWMAIESITDGIFSEKTDVWAYGVTCWEIFTGGKTPYPGIHPLELPNQLETGYRMEKPPNAACSQDMYNIVLNCWEKSPEARPQFWELVSRLSAFLGSMADYFVLSNPAVPEESECDQEKTKPDSSIIENIDEDTSF